MRISTLSVSIPETLILWGEFPNIFRILFFLTTKYTAASCLLPSSYLLIHRQVSTASYTFHIASDDAYMATTEPSNVPDSIEKAEEVNGAEEISSSGVVKVEESSAKTEESPSSSSATMGLGGGRGRACVFNL